MTDDIVTRLRQQADSGYIDEHDVMLRIAADEIERLREESAAWKVVAQEITMHAAMQELEAASDE
jgi:hypothetical protein